MTRIAGLAAVALLLVSCGAATPKPVSKAFALQELPKAEDVAFIEIQVGINSPVDRIEDPKVIAAAIAFLENDLEGWVESQNEPMTDGVSAAFVRKTDRDPFPFFIYSDHIDVGVKAQGEVHPGAPTINRFKTILGVEKLRKRP